MDAQGRLKVHILPADLGGCGRYRLLNAAFRLQDLGYDITIHDPHRPMPIRVFVGMDGTISDVEGPDADVLVMQRVTSKRHAQAIPVLRAKGYTVVMDADDDFTCIHPGNASFYELHPKSPTEHSWEHNRYAAQHVSLMTLSTQALTKVYGTPGRQVVLDNYIPARYLEFAHVDTPTFGWPGTLKSHPDDLYVCGQAAGQLEREGFQFIQAGPYEEEVARILGLARMKATGACDLKYWASTVSQLGSAWAPLSDTRFNRSKSRLKCIEANAVRVPYLASPLPEYARMTAEGGGGLLASKPGDWYKQGKRLLTDHKLRQELGAQGQAYAATQTIEEHAWKWMEAWQYAYDIDHGGTPIGSTAVVDLGRAVVR